MKNFLKTLIVAGSLFIATAASAGTVVLQWGAVTDSNLAGYKVYYSNTNTQPFTGTGAVQGPAPIVVPAGTTTATISGLDITKTYYFSVTTYNTRGDESIYSNIVNVPGPWFPSTINNLSITSVTRN